MALRLRRERREWHREQYDAVFLTAEKPDAVKAYRHQAAGEAAVL